ncbi:neprilysin-1-like isoform X1 [Dermacentor albipictus]|uniref:neprilysin-1-like isoform X1 n=1 Tax=Dermacentor albipictus TaxID=60249 RepID=UPI0038FC269B
MSTAGRTSRSTSGTSRSRPRSLVDPAVGPTLASALRSAADVTSPMPPGASSTVLLRGRQLRAGTGRASQLTGASVGDADDDTTAGGINAVKLLLMGGDGWSLLIGLAVWLCGFVLLAFVVSLVYPQAPRTPCSQPACLRLDSVMASSVSSRRHPCDDFFAYVCPATETDRRARVMLRENEFNAVVEHALSEESKFHGLGKLRDDCLRYRSTGSVRTKDILHLLHHHMGLPGWPLSTPADLTPQQLFELIAQLDFKYRVGAWARLRMDSDGGREMRTFLDPPSVLPQWFEDEEALERYVTQALAMFGASADAARIIVRLESSIHDLNVGSERRYSFLSVEAAALALEGILPASHWIDVLSTRTGLPRTTPVAFHEVLFRLLKLLLTSNASAFLYLGYRSLSMFGFDAHHSDLAARVDAPAIWLSPDQRVAHCHQLLWSANPVALNAALVLRKLAGSAQSKAAPLNARAFLNVVASQLPARLIEHFRMDHVTFTEARKKLSALKVSLPGDLASLKSLTPMLGNSSAWQPGRATPFLLNVLSLRALPASFLLDALTRPVDLHESEATPFLVPQRLTEPVLRPHLKAVAVPLGALTPPLFHESFPVAVKFAGLGRAFVGAALRAVGPEGEFRDHEGRPGPFSWWSEKSQESFRNATRCLGLPDSEELWRAAVSVRVAWDIFSLVRRADDGSTLSTFGLPFENDVGRLFFVAYCFFLCDKEDRPQRPSARDLCNVPLRNMADFAKAFNCSATSNMASSPRCFDQDRPSAAW